MPRPLIVLIALVVTLAWAANTVSALLGGPTVPEVNGIFTTLLTAGGIFGGAQVVTSGVRAWRGLPTEDDEAEATTVETPRPSGSHRRAGRR